MKTKHILILAALALLMAGSFVARVMLVTNRTQENITNRQIDDLLNRELPPGTSKTEVIQFLDHHGWPHSEQNRSVQSTVRDSSHNFLIRTDIQIRFDFDSDHKLLRHVQKELYTGP